VGKASALKVAVEASKNIIAGLAGTQAEQTPLTNARWRELAKDVGVGVFLAKTRGSFSARPESRGVRTKDGVISGRCGASSRACDRFDPDRGSRGQRLSICSMPGTVDPGGNRTIHAATAIGELASTRA